MIEESDLQTLALFDDLPVPQDASVARAVEQLAASEIEDGHGAVYTRPEVVEFILDLIGYTQDKPLHRARLLEPSFGAGDFLKPVIRRLLSSWRQHGGDLSDLQQALVAFELHRDTFDSTCAAINAGLVGYGFDVAEAVRLTGAWLRQGDFLLAEAGGQFDYVVGNPPYVRQELIPAPLLREYRRRFRTLYDRADLYVPFIERSLSLLKPGGQQGFICADRWMKNRYGGPLRAFVAGGFHLRTFVDMVGTQPFMKEVATYPAITVIAREKHGPTATAHRPDLVPDSLRSLAEGLTNGVPSERVKLIANVPNGDAPWLLDSADQMAVIRRLEAELPTLEEAGCKVGIGVATGADKAFIGDFSRLDVEPDRKLPLVTTKDIESGEVRWKGNGVINPFEDSGGLVDLAQYPRLAAHLERNRAAIQKRHCAQKVPANWYRTIDRITPALASKPKLLIPDIKGEAHIVLEHGNLYPHHNLYFVVSDSWDLRALQAILLSSVARLFINTYSTKMRGGFLRFQAQYLRRIRVPQWGHIAPETRADLIRAAESRNRMTCDQVVFDLYQLSPAERAALGEPGADLA